MTRDFQVIPGVTLCDACKRPLMARPDLTTADVERTGEFILAIENGIWHERCAPAKVRREAKKVGG